MKKRACIMIGLGMIALAACAPADYESPQAEAAGDDGRPGFEVVGKRFIDNDVGYICHKGRAVYVLDGGSREEMVVIDRAPECGGQPAPVL